MEIRQFLIIVVLFTIESFSHFRSQQYSGFGRKSRVWGNNERGLACYSRAFARKKKTSKCVLLYVALSARSSCRTDDTSLILLTTGGKMHMLVLSFYCSQFKEKTPAGEKAVLRPTTIGQRGNTFFCHAVTSILSQRLLHKMTNSRQFW